MNKDLTEPKKKRNFGSTLTGNLQEILIIF